MQGFTQKQDGLVNASDIAKTRVENPKDYLKRDQEVWVKVISTAGGRIRLSMRDVDQKSGKDLVPMGKAVEGKSNPQHDSLHLAASELLKIRSGCRNLSFLEFKNLCFDIALQVDPIMLLHYLDISKKWRPQLNLNMRMDLMTEILVTRGQQGFCGPSGYPGPVGHQDHG